MTPTMLVKKRSWILLSSPRASFATAGVADQSRMVAASKNMQGAPYPFTQIKQQSSKSYRVIQKKLKVAR